MAQTLTNMVKALSKKYPKKHIDIEKQYSYFACDKSFMNEYRVHILGIAWFSGLSFNQLLHKYKELLNNEKGE